jgi:xanthosine utilization system XapX-like protein
LYGNTLALWIGAGLALIGLIILLMARERYAVRIQTAEGEKNAVVSYKREYVAQIVDALNTAFDFNHNAADSTYVAVKNS